MKIPCSECQKSIDLSTKDFSEVDCEHCGKRITANHIANELEDPNASKNAAKVDDSYTRGHCYECGRNESVVTTREKTLICSNCGTSHEEYEKCRRCGDNNTADMSDSRIHGCSGCEQELQSRLDRD